MQALKMTSKRQVTFPRQVCKELGLEAGQMLLLEEKKLEGQRAWVLQPPERMKAEWYGSLRRYGAEKSHDMAVIRSSIGNAAKVKSS